MDESGQSETPAAHGAEEPWLTLQRAHSVLRPPTTRLEQPRTPPAAQAPGDDGEVV